MLVFSLILIYLFLPLLIIYLTVKSRIIDKIGAVIIAYALGLVLGNIGIIPRLDDFVFHAIETGTKVSVNDIHNWTLDGRIPQNQIIAWQIYKLQDIMSSAAIPLALPLLLFSMKIKLWFRMSGKALLSMVLAIFSALGFIVLGYFLFGKSINGSKEIAGMLVGLYTGGTPNLASLKEMLKVDEATYIMTHTYDTMVSVIYLLFLISFGKILFRKLLLPYPHTKHERVFKLIPVQEEHAYYRFFAKEYRSGLIKALLLAIGVFGVSAMFSFLMPKSVFLLVVILSITTLSIVLSLVPFVNRIEKTFELGMYFIIVFSLVVATMADVHKLINISGILLGYISLVVFGSLSLHAILCKVFKVDADTFMVSSTALICSPPFVPMVASSLNNREVIVSGLTVGIVGYALGNYLGVIVVALL